MVTALVAESLVPLAERNVESWSPSWSLFFLDVFVLELFTVLLSPDEMPVERTQRRVNSLDWLRSSSRIAVAYLLCL